MRFDPEKSIITPDLLEGLPDQPQLKIRSLILQAFPKIKVIADERKIPINDEELKKIPEWIELVQVARAYSQKHKIAEFQKYLQSPRSTDHYSFFKRIIKNEEDRREKQAVKNYIDSTIERLDNEIGLELNTDDVRSIKHQLQQLREAIEATSEIAEYHKARVIKRLNELDTETHTKMTTMENLYGVLCSASIIIMTAKEEGEPAYKILKMLMKEVLRLDGHSKGLALGTEFPDLTPKLGEKDC